MAQEGPERRSHRSTQGISTNSRPFLLVVLADSSFPWTTVLTRLGFGLNIAPLVLKKVLCTVLSWDERIDRATSPYFDDILVDESIASSVKVETHLRRHGLACKQTERVSEGTRVLGIRVWGERRALWRKRDKKVCELPKKLTRRTVFSICGQLTSHLPVWGG